MQVWPCRFCEHASTLQYRSGVQLLLATASKGSTTIGRNSRFRHSRKPTPPSQPCRDLYEASTRIHIFSFETPCVTCNPHVIPPGSTSCLSSGSPPPSCARGQQLSAIPGRRSKRKAQQALQPPKPPPPSTAAMPSAKAARGIPTTKSAARTPRAETYPVLRHPPQGLRRWRTTERRFRGKRKQRSRVWQGTRLEETVPRAPTTAGWCRTLA